MKRIPRVPREAPRARQGGVMLLEALVAILIFSLGIIALMGLQANSIAQVSQAKYRTDASYLANQVFGRMWLDTANPLSSYTSPGYTGRQGWDALVASTLPNGTATIAVAGTQATVTINWRQPEDTVTHKYVAVAQVNH